MAEQGVVKWFNARRGDGVITRADGQEVFIHQATTVGESAKSLREDDRVSFDVVEGPKGLQAKNVAKVS